MALAYIKHINIGMRTEWVRCDEAHAVSAISYRTNWRLLTWPSWSGPVCRHSV